jgi:hypothetical protein
MHTFCSPRSPGVLLISHVTISPTLPTSTARCLQVTLRDILYLPLHPSFSVIHIAPGILLLNNPGKMDISQTQENAEAGPSSLPAAADSSIIHEDGGNHDETPPMSKKAMKKAAKRARAESEKLVRRAAEKGRRKVNAAKRKADLQAGLLSPEEVEEFRKRQEAVKLRKKLRAKGGDLVKDDAQTWKGGVVIDCGFDELMNEQVSA